MNQNVRISLNRIQTNLRQQPTNSAQFSRRGHGTRTGGIHESVARYKFQMSGANRQQLRGGCGVAAAEYQFVSRQAVE